MEVNENTRVKHKKTERMQKFTKDIIYSYDNRVVLSLCPSAQLVP